jgi:hypothetical protein
MSRGRFADEDRSARLLFAPELAAGTLTPAELDRRDIRAALSSKPVPSRVGRLYQRMLFKRGKLGYEQTTVPTLAAAREAVLGAAAAGPPRPLIRIDEFPHAEGFDERGARGVDVFRRLHDSFMEAGVSYLLAVSPRVARDYLDPHATEIRPLSDAERELLSSANREGVAFGLHGLDHRTRHAGPRRHGEWVDYAADELGERLDVALAELEEARLRPRVFVPPFNRFDAKRWATLAERFDVICGGPESVTRMGFHHTPLARRGAVYLPCYPPLYGLASDAARALGRLRDAGAALWVPIVVHSGWEARDGWGGLRELVRVAAGLQTSWDPFLDASVAAGADA